MARANGATMQVAEVPPGPPVLQTMVAEVYGPEAGRRQAVAQQIKSIFDRTPGVVDVDWYVESPQAKFSLAVDGEKAAAAGLSPSDLASVVRIAASWKEPPDALGLRKLSTDVHYGPVPLGSGEPYWLPQDAKIELATQHQNWRNEHRFSNYRRFSVDVREEVAGPRPLESLEGGKK